MKDPCIYEGLDPDTVRHLRRLDRAGDYAIIAALFFTVVAVAAQVILALR